MRFLGSIELAPPTASVLPPTKRTRATPDMIASHVVASRYKKQRRQGFLPQVPHHVPHWLCGASLDQQSHAANQVCAHVASRETTETNLMLRGCIARRAASRVPICATSRKSLLKQPQPAVNRHRPTCDIQSMPLFFFFFLFFWPEPSSVGGWSPEHPI